MRVRLSQGSLATVHLKAPEGKKPHLLLAAKLDDASALLVIIVYSGKERNFLDLLLVRRNSIVVFIADGIKIVPKKVVHQHTLAYNLM